jgi:hypothetical protein
MSQEREHVLSRDCWCQPQIVTHPANDNGYVYRDNWAGDPDSMPRERNT